MLSHHTGPDSETEHVSESSKLWNSTFDLHCETMHSTYQRFNQLSATLSSCLIALFFAIALSSLAMNAISPPHPKAKLGVHSVKVYVLDLAMTFFLGLILSSICGGYNTFWLFLKRSCAFLYPW